MVLRMKGPWLVGALVALMTSQGLGQNVLLNPGFEDSPDSYPHWNLLAGSLNGLGLGQSPRTGSRSWHGAWNHAGSAQSTTWYQEVAMSPGSVCTASMWCKANAWDGIYGNNTHRFRLRLRFLDAANNNLITHSVFSPDPDDTYQQLVISDVVAPAGTVKAWVMFTYITDQPAHAWKVWNVDDLSLEVAGNEAHAISSISP